MIFKAILHTNNKNAVHLPCDSNKELLFYFPFTINNNNKQINKNLGYTLLSYKIKVVRYVPSSNKDKIIQINMSS